MKRTPLYEAHVAHGGKIVDFAGWAMPLHYSGVVDEYHAVRTTAGLFDVSHMGRIQMEGADAVSCLQRVATNDVTALSPFHSHYSMICNPEGGVKDDVFIYQLAQEKFLLCVNASNREKIVHWVQQQCDHKKDTVRIEDHSDHLAQLALQGPAALTIIRSALGADLDHLKPRQCTEINLWGSSCLIARTGYTGERGYEVYIPASQILRLWNTLMASGQTQGLKPAGLGARDLLRLDMGYFLYGHDLTEAITPIEAGAEWLVAWEKGTFIGDDVLRRQQVQGVSRRLVAFALLTKAVPRQGMTLFANGTEIGTITSGNLSPLLQQGIGLGYVPPSFAAIGTTFEVESRGRRIPAQVVKLPFYKKPTPPRDSVTRNE